MYVPSRSFANCISPWRNLRVCVIKFKENQYYEANIFLFFFSFTLTTEKKIKTINKYVDQSEHTLVVCLLNCIKEINYEKVRSISYSHDVFFPYFI